MNRTPGLYLTHHPTIVGEYATTLNPDVSWIEKKSSAISENSDLRGRCGDVKQSNLPEND